MPDAAHDVYPLADPDHEIWAAGSVPDPANDALIEPPGWGDAEPPDEFDTGPSDAQPSGGGPSPGLDAESPGLDAESPGGVDTHRSRDVDAERSDAVDTHRSGEVDAERSGEVDAGRRGEAAEVEAGAASAEAGGPGVDRLAEGAGAVSGGRAGARAEADEAGPRRGRRRAGPGARTATAASGAAVAGSVGADSGVGAGVLGGRAEPRSHRRAKEKSSAVGHIREPELADFWRGWLGRTTALLFGVLLLGAGFIASYVGALHQPTARALPVGVVSGDAPAQTLLTAVEAKEPDVLSVRVYASADEATDALANRRIAGVLGSADGGGLSLAVAGAAAPGAAEALERVVGAATGTAGIRFAVVDVHPLSAKDPRGLTAFYTVVGLLIGGYLAATVLAITLGTVPRNGARLGLRLAAFGVFAVALGLAGAVLTGPVYDIWPDHLLSRWLAGALVVFVGAVVTAALEAWLGLVGTGLAMALLFILGNPGSGGVFAPQLLPTFYGPMHWWNPTGLATDLLRAVVYFDGAALRWPLSGLLIWAVVGVAGVLGATAALGRRVHDSR